MKKEMLVVVFVVLAVLHVYLGAGSIKAQSPTYDEPVHLTAGYVYWKTGNFLYNGYHHPAFAEMWAAMPLLFLNPFLPKQHPAWRRQQWNPFDQYQFADYFLYKNKVDHERLIEAGRFAQLSLSILLGAILAGVAFYLGGGLSSLLAMGFWSVSPTMLAHGTLISTDFAFTVFFFAFFCGFLFLKKKWGLILTGLALGLCFSSKYLVLGLGPALFVLAAFVAYQKKKIWFFTKDMAFQAGVVSLIAFLFVLLIYQFSELGVYVEGFSRIFGRSQAGRSAFFFGDHRTTGWLLYFPALLLLKTPLPLVLSVIGAVVLAVKKKFTLPPYLWIPPLVFFALACVSKVQIGHRHILVMYPFLILIAALALGQLSKKARFLGAAAFVWMAVGTGVVHPYYITYFNELVGGSSQGYRYYTDSNVDWGQGLKAVRSHLDEKDIADGIYLSYFGVADPHAYGLRYIDVGSDFIAAHKDNRTEPNLNPTKFVISATNLQETYYRTKTVFDWLADYTPKSQVANSIFIYDFKDQPKALQILQHLSQWKKEAK